jgi:hypothetical protein
MIKLTERPHVPLRYEDRFFEDRDAVASGLRLAVAPDDIARIFDLYRTEAVRSFSGGLKTLPPDRVFEGGGMLMDSVTQMHATHIGDTRSGKWRDLPRNAQTKLTEFFAPFLDRFGYPR